MKNWYRTYQSILESSNGVIPVLYHGTCSANARALVENGWHPNSGSTGGNMGQSRYLYMTTGYEDALWFAEEKGCDAVVKAENVPIAYLIVDPEDGVGDTVEDEIAASEKHGMPAKLALKVAVQSPFFSLVTK